MLRLSNIRIRDNLNEEQIVSAALKKYRIPRNELLSHVIVRKSIDARNKDDVFFSYTLDVNLRTEGRFTRIPQSPVIHDIPVIKNRRSSYDPIIIGSGPAGLFCAITLIENGYKPIIIERGDRVENRRKAVDEFRKSRVFNPAGTFSDGKLTTGISSPFINKVLQTFRKFGAPEEVTYLAHPHIGTDKLYEILQNIRHYIEENGGRYYFNTTLRDFRCHDGIIDVICDKESFVTDAMVLAIGHSARDTFEMLKDRNMEMKRKNFSVGVRIEHLQEMINMSQYGTKTKLALPPAEYKLAYHSGKRACYTFCMCPGGEVIASGSEKDGIVTNGMSEYARDGRNANAALLVNVDIDDLPGSDVMEGFRFQRELEHKAWLAGGSNGNAPIQRLEDFMTGNVSDHVGKVIPSYKPGYAFADMNKILPDYVCKTMKEGIRDFDRKIAGYGDPDSLLTGVETRTSSPVTVVRNEDLVSSIHGIYPCGEGCGYAGGITSAAVDGIKVARKIIESTK